MKARHLGFVAVMVFVAGVVAGVYVQHRWPLGRMLRPAVPAPTPALASLEELARLPRTDRLVIVAAGQSNAGNHGSERASGGGGVYAFANGKLFAAIDPLPGASGDGGSIWTRLGATLVSSGRFKAVIIAAIAQGSTRADDWAPNGWCHPKLVETLQQLNAAGLPPDFILWQQGETEAWTASAFGEHYARALESIIERCRELSPNTRFVVARANYADGAVLNEQIRFAQMAITRAGALAGPNMDRLAREHRNDGVHFNALGLSAAAELWLAALSPYLEPQIVPKASP